MSEYKVVATANGNYEVTQRIGEGRWIASFHSEELAQEWANGEYLADEAWREYNRAGLAVKIVRKPGAYIAGMSFQNSTLDGSLVSEEEQFTVTVVLKDGTEFTPKIGRSERSNYAHSTPVYEEGETIRDAMFRLGLTGKIVRVVVTSRGHDHTEGREWEDWDVTTVYIPMSGDVVTAKDLAISLAAQKFAAKKIGFGEFKRIIRENS